MFLQALYNQVPDDCLQQSEMWDCIDNLPAVASLKPSSRTLLRRILQNASGIRKRHFCSSDLDALFQDGPEELNRRFERDAPELGARALRGALARSGLEATDLDALFVCTCTGYICPGVTSHVAEQVGCRPDCQLVDLVGLGCGAAIPMLRQAAHWITTHPSHRVACLAVEVCSAAFYLDDDAGVLISAALFGDGASASIWNGQQQQTGNAGLEARPQDFQTLHLPEHRDLLRFTNAGGKLKNLLASTVPELAGDAVRRLISPDSLEHPGQLLVHPGGSKVIDAIARHFPGQELAASRSVMENFGNLSSPSIMFCLEEAMNGPHPLPPVFDLCSFGAGFSAHACRVHINS